MSEAADLLPLVEAAAAGRGVASASVIHRPGAEPRTAWVPASPGEPAFLVYSITKTITAAVALMLRDEGRLRLEDSLARWFPRVAGAERITLRHLLNHTAGIPDYGGLRAYHESVRASPSSPWSFERFAAETFGKGLAFAPGEGWAYSNPGYMLVRRVIEQVAGRSFAALVAERVARPLGLSRTTVPESIEGLASLAPGTSCLLDPAGSPVDVRTRYHPGWVSHGVVASTASDIARFLDSLFGGRVISSRSLAEMLSLVAVPGSASPASPPAGSRPRLPWVRPSYGLGVMADPDSPWGLLVGHNGGGPCYGASAVHAVDRGITACAMGAIEEGFDAEALVAAILGTAADRAGG